MIFKNTSKLLKRSRQKAKLTQFVLAKNLGLSSVQFVSNFERGKSAPPIKYWRTIAKTYNIRLGTIKLAYLNDINLHIKNELIG